VTVAVSLDGRDGRRARLRDELLDERVPLPIDTMVGELLLDELLAARRPARHEGRPPRYGSLITAAPFPWDQSPGTPASINAEGLEGDDLRRCADGRGSFVLAQLGQPRDLVCFRHTMEYEATAVNLVRATGVFVVQRNLGGVRVCGPEGVIHWDGDNWTFKPLAERYVGPLLRLAPMADPAVLRSLLELCVHWLSAGRVGATIVWHLGAGPDRGSSEMAADALSAGPAESSADSPAELTDTSAPADAGGAISAPAMVVIGGPAKVDTSTAIRAPRLQLGHPEHHPAALALLAQIDRAVELGPSGELLRAGVALLGSREAHELVPTLGGTRHTSARRFSFDAPDSIVFVVSESGPVTVFADGGVEAQVRMDPCHSGFPLDLLEMEPHPDDQTTVRCDHCERLLLVDVVDFPNWKGGPELLECPVCAGAIEVPVYRAAIRGVRKEPLAALAPNAGGGHGADDRPAGPAVS
jgi:hypothetical protein